MKNYLLALGIFCLTAGTLFGQDYSKMEDVHASVLKNWLSEQTTWRPAGFDDYDKEIVKFGREQESDKFIPFYASADFNLDSQRDFAVILVSRSSEKKFAAAIFNAPFDPGKRQEPTFFVPNLQEGDGVFFINQLLIGPYASDNIMIISPVCKSYKIEIPEFGS